MPFSAEDIDNYLSEPTEGARSVAANIEGDVMVVGAGGKMGLHLARMLRKSLPADSRVIAVSRFTSNGGTEAFTAHGVETIRCDLMDQASVEQLPDCRNVFYLAGQKFGTGSDPSLTWMMNVVVPAFVAAKFKTARIVAFSTGCVYPFVAVDSGGSREEDALQPVGEYANSCLGRERLFTHYTTLNGTPVTLFRLNYAVEPRYGVPVDLGLKILAGDEIDLSMGHVNLIWQRDAVARAIQALELAESPAVPINVSGPETVSIRALSTRLGLHLGKEPRFAGVESETAWLCNAGESFRLWGYPETSLDEIVGCVADWLKNGGATLAKPTQFQSREGKY